ncbi:MAG: diaminopimelate epimerase [Bacteroidia bacterium]
MQNLTFYKYQGTGNDFILIDNRGQQLEKELTTEHIAKLCDRRFGIGADGLMLLSDAAGYDFRMIYYNSDGRESSMCGNGGRCITAFAKKVGLEKEVYHFLAIDGEHEAMEEARGIKLKMGKPHSFQLFDNNNMWIHTGSPHYVQLHNADVSTLEVNELGKKIRYNDTYKQEGTNVNFVNLVKEGVLKVRTYERGVEAETLSCGTGVTACAYTYIIWNSRIKEVSVLTEGGELWVEVVDFHQESEAVYLIGAATFVFEGKITVY